MICLAIVGRNEVEKAIKEKNPDFVISVKDIIRKFEWHVWHFPKKLLFEFEDWETEEPGGPQRKHIEQLINFGRNHKGKTFVVNCEAGVSRSSAIAIILRHLEGMPIEANFEDIATRFPRCFPNKLMIKFAQEILNVDFISIYETWEPLWRMRESQRNGGGYGIF